MVIKQFSSSAFILAAALVATNANSALVGEWKLNGSLVKRTAGQMPKLATQEDLRQQGIRSVVAIISL